MEYEYDAAIVGSGPAGAACALGLARLGFSILLIDEREFPRSKACGEYVNCGAVRELRDLGLAERFGERALTLRGMRLFAHGEEAEFRFPSEAWSIPRMVLDNAIRDEALQAGAEAMRGRVREVTFGESAVTVTVVDGNLDARMVRARYLIGADGMRSTVAKACGMSARSEGARFATGGHYGGVALERWIEMYAGPQGYLALNPLDDDTANVMFVVSRAQLQRSRGALNGELARFSHDVTRGARELDDSTLREKRQTIGPLSHRTARVAARRVLLVGDAAAFVDPFSGQGVYLALIGARVAVSAVARALRSAEDEDRAWYDYAHAIHIAVAERGRMSLMMKAMLGLGFATRRAARALRRYPAEFTPLIDAVCGMTLAPSGPRIAMTLARALR